jgi:thiamine transport system substrate-binding protein
MFGCTKESNKNQQKSIKKSSQELTIYSYDSFVESWGLGPKIIPEFEKKFKCKVKLVGCGDAGQLLNKIIKEKENPTADVVVGIDNTYLEKALSENILQTFEPENLSNIKKSLLFDKTSSLSPYDYGYFAFVYNSETIKNPPVTFGEMQDPKWEKNFIFIDPRTSSVGNGLLLWSIAAFGENGYGHFWKSMKQNILTTPASWGDAYNMFLAGEAPIVLSYSTSPAYHIENDSTYKYKAFIPQEGGFMQIEGCGIISKCKHPNLSKEFVNYMLSDQVQKFIPETQWMYPSNSNIKLPESFDNLPLPTKILNKNINLKIINENSEKWIKRWIKIMSK